MCPLVSYIKLAQSVSVDEFCIRHPGACNTPGPAHKLGGQPFGCMEKGKWTVVAECKWACTKRSRLGCRLSRACIEALGGLTKTKPELTKLLEYTNIVVNINTFTYVRKVRIIISIIFCFMCYAFLLFLVFLVACLDHISQDLDVFLFAYIS